MKKKEQAPHDEIKAYLKTCKERIDQAFFTRPEWRHPKTVGGVNVIISRLNEVYYPFSDRKKPKSAIWKQVLHEKREEMIAEIRSAIKTESKIKKIDKAADLGIPAKTIPRLAVDRELPNILSPAETWTTERIERLWNQIKSTRSASKIGRELSCHSSFIKHVLLKGSAKNQAFWLPKIKAAMDALMKPALTTEVDTSEAEKSINEVTTQFNKDDINHKNFIGQEYPQGIVKPDIAPVIGQPCDNYHDDILAVARRIYDLIEGTGFGRSMNQKRQIIGVVAQLIDPNLVLTR